MADRNINDLEYDRLTVNDQRSYKWCGHCDLYYHTGFSGVCGCPESFNELYNEQGKKGGK